MLQLSTIVAAICCVCCVAGYDLFVDLTSGTTLHTSSSLSWATSLYGSGTCGKKGVLKLSFGAPGSANRKNKVLIDMWFNNPSGWVFNIGDSPTNNGYGGDSATTSGTPKYKEPVLHFVSMVTTRTVPQVGFS
ncbi:uncharacterized protein LOC124292005 [Haliotis rubra]|uniref:uncharacterized protein LOC124292005 n=1 Tax=Haliotis rubra TaxID=36100 RepID=UPI001EE4F202|nr:uncharacterized protein LOC124292005 [Haliotis rubra]